MKKGILGAVILWFVMILGVILIYTINNTETESKSYRITVNRMHYEISSLLKEGKYDKATDYISDQVELYSDIESITIINLNDDEHLAVFAGEDIQSDRLVFSIVDHTGYLIRYEISDTLGKNGHLLVYSIISLTLLSICLITVFIFVNSRLIKPLREFSALPKKLAKGHFSYKVEQDKYGYYREFLWGLDMLREVLYDEKKKNIELEKNRKTLVASLSHDINTPLSYIQNYCDSLIDDIYDDEYSKINALNMIKDKSIVIEKLTKELLDSSKNMMDNLVIKSEEIYTYDLFATLNQLISQKVDLHRIDYNFSVPENNGLLFVDIDRIIEVVDNVIENAIKYGDGKQINVVTDNEDNCLLIKIENTGQQISEKELKYVFSSFYRGSNIGNKPGHGLGLHIVKKIMKAMEGDVYLHNTEDGVCVVIIIRMVS